MFASGLACPPLTHPYTNYYFISFIYFLTYTYHIFIFSTILHFTSSCGVNAFKIGGRPQYFRMTHYTEILNIFWQNLDYQLCTMLFSNRVVLYIIWDLAGWYLQLVNMNKRYIRKHDFSKWLKICRNTKKESFTIDNVLDSAKYPSHFEVL